MCNYSIWFSFSKSSEQGLLIDSRKVYGALFLKLERKINISRNLLQILSSFEMISEIIKFVRKLKLIAFFSVFPTGVLFRSSGIVQTF